MNASSPAYSASSMRHALTVTHLFLVAMGSVNLIIIFLILTKRYMRSITNVYIVGLCLADFIYLFNLTLVAATQLSGRSWPFGDFLCTLYHGSETTGKYAAVMFVVLLAVDRYCAMCSPNMCARYRSYNYSFIASLFAWVFAVLFSSPLYIFASTVSVELRGETKKICIARWPNSDWARWYISCSSIFVFVVPLAIIIYCYYHILNKLREAVKGSKRLRRGASSRAPYQKVTRLVLWVVVFHVICWSPFWLFNLVTSIFRIRINTPFERIVVNIIHLFPYINCSLNPLLYAIHAENFRHNIVTVLCLLPRMLRQSCRSDKDCDLPPPTKLPQVRIAYRTSNDSCLQQPIYQDRNHSIIRARSTAEPTIQGLHGTDFLTQQNIMFLPELSTQIETDGDGSTMDFESTLLSASHTHGRLVSVSERPLIAHMETQHVLMDGDVLL